MLCTPVPPERVWSFPRSRLYFNCSRRSRRASAQLHPKCEKPLIMLQIFRSLSTSIDAVQTSPRTGNSSPDFSRLWLTGEASASALLHSHSAVDLISARSECPLVTWVARADNRLSHPLYVLAQAGLFDFPDNFNEPRSWRQPSHSKPKWAWLPSKIVGTFRIRFVATDLPRLVALSNCLSRPDARDARYQPWRIHSSMSRDDRTFSVYSQSRPLSSATSRM